MHEASDGIGTTTNITASGMLDPWAPTDLTISWRCHQLLACEFCLVKKTIFSKLKIHHQQLLFLISPSPTFITYMHNGCNSLVNQLHYQSERRGGGDTIFNWYAEHATRIQTPFFSMVFTTEWTCWKMCWKKNPCGWNQALDQVPPKRKTNKKHKGCSFHILHIRSTHKQLFCF